jgi:hypothetical protein
MAFPLLTANAPFAQIIFIEHAKYKPKRLLKQSLAASFYFSGILFDTIFSVILSRVFEGIKLLSKTSSE